VRLQPRSQINVEFTKKYFLRKLKIRASDGQVTAKFFIF